MAKVTYYVRCNDITPTRCTVLEVYSRESAAQADSEDDDEQGVFEADTDEFTIGERAYHHDGACWPSAQGERA